MSKSCIRSDQRKPGGKEKAVNTASERITNGEALNNVVKHNEEDTDIQLQNLFQACDTKGRGYIVVKELQDLCEGLGIGHEDAEAIFTDLDHDKDGRISYKDFCTGFKEFLHPDMDEQSRRRSLTEELQHQMDKISVSSMEMIEEDHHSRNFSTDILRRKSVYQAWTNFTSNLVDLNLLSLAPECNSHIQLLCEELQGTTVPKEVASRVENVFTSLISELQLLQEQNASLQDMYKKEKEGHLKTLRSLEVEMEDQMSKVEQTAKERAKQESQEEKRQLQDQMDQEVAEMQAHLKIFQKVDTWLKKETDEDVGKIQSVRTKLEEAHHNNRELSMKLQETSTSMALLRTDLSQSRLQYEEKCQELHSEREQVLEYMHQYETMKRQLELIHEANKRLHDTNDSLRETIDFEFRKSPLGSLCSSHRSNLRKRNQRTKSPIPVQLSLSGSDSEGQLVPNYGIKRLLEDLDSGLSTLPDAAEDTLDESFTDHGGPMSLEKELDDVFPVNPIRVPTPTKPATLQPSKLHPTNNTDTNNGSHNLTIPSNFNNYNYSSNYEVVMGPPDRTYKVVFAGDAAVGKSTFIVRLCKGVFMTDMASTLGVDYKVKSLRVDDKNMAIQLWDTAGQERFRSITKTYFRRADGVLLLYDITSERSFLNVRQWVDDLNNTCLTHVPMVICGNKCDYRESDNLGGRIVSTEDGEKLARDYGAHFFETSSKTGRNVIEALVDLARQMATNEDVEVLTSTLRLQPTDSKSRCCSASNKNR